jgi:hypothetical protein
LLLYISVKVNPKIIPILTNNYDIIPAYIAKFMKDYTKVSLLFTAIIKTNSNRLMPESSPTTQLKILLILLTHNFYYYFIS